MAPTEDESLVRRTDSADVVTLTLNRPRKLNAFDDPMLEAFHEKLTALVEDPAGGLLITGAGRATCAGRDTDIVSDPDYHGGGHPFLDEIGPLIRAYPRPTAMAGKGAVIGMGFEYSLACDFVVFGEETQIAFPEIQYDIDVSDFVGELIRYVNPRVAKEMVMTGEPISPGRAHELGLANDVVPEDAVEERTRELLENVVRHETDILENMLSVTRLAEESPTTSGDESERFG